MLHLKIQAIRCSTPRAVQKLSDTNSFNVNTQLQVQSTVGYNPEINKSYYCSKFHFRFLETSSDVVNSNVVWLRFPLISNDFDDLITFRSTYANNPKTTGKQWVTCETISLSKRFYQLVPGCVVCIGKILFSCTAHREPQHTAVLCTG